MPRKILIDTDPGIDDAMAILFALRSPELEVIGLSAVFGNTDVDVTAQNSLRLVELEGNNSIPVAKGASKPMVIAPRSMGKLVHGEDGMGGVSLPPPEGKLVDLHAAQFIVEIARAHPGAITLVPLGPLTNVALALLIEPQLPELLKDVIIMGGSAYARGNATPAAEANISNDPHAARIVFSAPWQLTMVGLDVTTQVVMTPGYLDELFRAGNRATDLFARILPFYQKFHTDVYAMEGAIHTHDPSAIAYAIQPGLFRCEKMPVFVETTGLCAGETVPDPRRKWLSSPEINVCIGVEADGLLNLFKDRLSTP